MIFALFALAFGVRIAYAAVAGATGFIDVAETYDYGIATRIHSDLGLLATPYSTRAPGFHFVLVSAFLVTGPHHWAALLLQTFLASATVIFVYRIGERRLGPGVGLISALWLALFVHHIYFTALMTRDILTTLLLVFLVYLLGTPFHRMRYAAWTALVFAALIHVDPQFILFFPLIFVFLIFSASQHRFLSLQYAFIFAGATLVFSVPWALRNYFIYGELVPVALEGGWYTRPVFQILMAGTPYAGPYAAPENAPGFWHYTVEFWRVVQTGPQQPLGDGWSFRHNLSNLVTFGTLLPLAAYGTYLSVRTRNRGGIVLAGVTLAYYLIRAFYGSGERARLPIEPLIILLAAFGALQLINAIRGRRADPSPSSPPA